MSSVTRNLVSHFPITAKLSPFRRENLKYLFASAIVTRFGVSVLRTEENHPKRLKALDMTQTEKKQAFAERIFMEFGGTAAYIILLHLGQDIGAKFIEKWQKSILKNAKVECLNELSEGNFGIKKEDFSKTFDKILNNLNTRNIISRMLYPDKLGHRITKGEFCNDLGISVDRELPKAFDKLAKRLNAMCFGALFTGVLVSAVIGGYGIQLFNDKIFSKYIKRKYPEVMPKGFLTLPSSSSSTTLFSSSNNPFANTLQTPPQSGGGSAK